MAVTAVEIFLENLERLISCPSLDFMILHEKEQLQALHDELVFLRDFLKNSEEMQDEHSKVKNLIRDVAHKAETIVDWFTVEAFRREDLTLANKPGCFLDVADLRKEIGTIKIEVEEIYATRINKVEILKDVAESSSSSVGSSQQTNLTKLEGVIVVGFDDEASRIIQELDGGQKQLNSISIVGAPGAGKTTLARKVYNDRLIQARFAIRGWVVVSQVYDKKDLLIGILETTNLMQEGDCDLSYDELGEQLYRQLRDKKYLVVIDDIWSVEAWNDIQRSFPDDSRGSRIMFTTRLSEVDEKIAQHHHDLPPLSYGYSWELLQRQVFGKQSCPSELVQTGKEVARKCRGLPLAILVIAGILVKRPTVLSWWKQVAGSLSSIIAANQEVYMDMLALSYNHLPLHLKACFLYLGAFPEDYEIPVRKLILLWIAEGFVKQSAGITLEGIAEGYLMDLVGRSLTMVARKGPDGRMKACRVHDLLRELCMKKAKEEYCFWHCRLQFISDLNTANTVLDPNLRTFLRPKTPYSSQKLCGVSCKLNLLSVLDLSSKYLDRFPVVVVNFVHLRYLAIAARTIHLPPSISNLWNLETLILHTEETETVHLPEMGKTTRMRHIIVKRRHHGKKGRFHFENPSKPFSSWDNLQTLDRLCPCKGCLTFLKTTRNLKKLGICKAFGSDREVGCLMFRDTPFSEQLVELKMFDIGSALYSNNILDQVFPQSIRKLTLQCTHLEWKDMTILGQLPRLEVLILLYGAFVEGVWDPNEDEFCRLKYLRMQHLDILEWNSCADHFPNLETLELKYLDILTELPYDFAELTSLEKIVVRWCHRAVKDFARQIKEEHYNYYGEHRLQVSLF